MNLEIAQAIVEARTSAPFESGTAFSQRLSTPLPGEAISFLTAALSSRFSLVATAWVDNSASRRSVRLVAKRDNACKSGVRRLIYYDEYWPLPELRKWTEMNTDSELYPLYEQIRKPDLGENL